jgi:hypothetical protein
MTQLHRKTRVVVFKKRKGKEERCGKLKTSHAL